MLWQIRLSIFDQICCTKNLLFPIFFLMNRVIHFEIQADDITRARDFYERVFSWQFVDYSSYTGSPYWGILTAPEGSTELGINGGLLPRPAPIPDWPVGINGCVATIGVEDFDAISEMILSAGGTVALSKMALPGMAWQGYFLDTEGNTFGVHQADTDAK